MPDFSSTHSTAFSGGLRYRPTTSTTFSTKNGSADSLNVPVDAENLCHQAILVNHASGTVAPLDPELIQVVALGFPPSRKAVNAPVTG
jgi:hypothetical protein